ncbi:hypothetical protein CHS0354_031223 [Potamilus streckersoni]|uniref:HYR domain-containing protein n=1 Tax=Potamilus streckersoni TaxID=2493646 RepID=A0AAE0RU52_9BIVA|nr:hypothetical protein CHS0354_031223 [Potamilus streckersoni]
MVSSTFHKIIRSNGTHIMRKLNDAEEYAIIRKISYSPLNLKRNWIPCLAVDWREEQLFWFEEADFSKAIHTSNLDGTMQRIIINKDIECVTSMAVDERNKILYWSDCRKETIERADYDGINGRIIHSNDLYRVVVLAVDSIHALLYWSEERFNKIYSSKTDGSDRKIANTFDQYPSLVKVDIEIQQESDSNLLLYWKEMNSTHSFRNCTALFNCLIQNLTTEMTEGLRSVSFAIRPKYQHYQREGVCKNMRCSHVCMPTNETYARCSCPSFGGLILVSERNCSIVSEPFLLYSDDVAGYIGIAELHPRYPSPDNFLVVKAKKPRGIAYDKIEKMVYFYEESNQTIFKIQIDGTGLMEVLRLQDGQRTTIKALAIDSVQRRLYFTLSEVNVEYGVYMIRTEALDLESEHRRTVIVGEDINPDILYILHDRLHFVRNWTCMLSDMDGFNAAQGSCSTNVSIDKLINAEGPLNFIVDEQDESEIIVRQQGEKLEIWQDQTKTISAFNVTINAKFAIATTTLNPRGTGRMCDKFSDKKACEGLCFRTLTETIARCHCPTYRFNVLQEDVRNCSAPDEFLLFSEGIEIRMLGRGRTPDTSVYTIAESTDGDITSFAFHSPYVYFITQDASLQYSKKRSTRPALYRKSVENLQTETVTTFDTPVSLIQLYDNRIYWVSHDGTSLFVRSMPLHGNETRIHFERTLDIIPKAYAFDAYGNVFIIFEQSMRVLVKDATHDILCDTPEGRNPSAAIIDDANRILYVATESNSIEYISAIPERLSCVNKTLVWKRINIQAPSPNEARITSMALSSGRLHVILKPTQKRNAILMTIDLTMTKVNKTEQMNAIDPKGLLAFLEEIRDSYEPGIVIKPGNCPMPLQGNGTCLEYECITDYGCGGDGTICCPGFELFCKKCARPVSNHQYIDATCKECHNGVCRNLTCPTIGDCSAISKLNCCPICLDITYCLEKPKIEGCPNDVSSFTLPNNSDSVQIDVNSHPFSAISAYDCSSKRLHIQLRKESLTWQSTVQDVDVIAKNMNGESVCKVLVLVRDVTAPWFLSCPSDMEFYSKDQFTTATWFDPVADDNVAKPPILQQEDKHYQSPMDVSVGTLYSFKYTARDYDGNRGPPCSFTIYAHKLETSCSSPPQIQQGSLFCKGDSDSVECHIKKCAKDFIIMPEFNETFRCQNGRWVPPFNDSMQTRACLKMEFISLALQLNVDLLNNDTETPNEDYVIECFQKLFLCPEPKTNELYNMCTNENIQLIRNENILHLEINATHKLRFNETAEGVKSELNKTITALSLGFSKRSISTYCLQLTGQIQYMSQEEYIFCEPGSILLPSKINCTMCPPGEYEAGSTCRQCPRGYYTNLPGQTECVKCDGDKTTHSLASYSKAHCVSMIAVTPVSNNTFLIVGIVCGTLLLISIVVAVTVYKLKRAKKSGYPTGAFMDETYLSLSGKTNENPYGNRKSVYDEIPADAVM